MSGDKLTNLSILPLAEARDPHEVGHKAAVLGQLIRAGLRVPRGFVIPLPVYWEHSQRALAAVPRHAAVTVKAAAVAETETTVEFRRLFQDAWKSMISGWAAVRSSATMEDSHEGANAGRFETILHVTDPEAGIDAVRQCWASLWSPHWGGSAASEHDENDRSGMGVIVQEMVKAEFAGVAFSCEPTTGATDVLYVEWVAGTGDSLVSGEDLSGRAWLDTRGAIERVDYERDDAFPETEVLSRIANLLKRVSEELGEAVDIEWAWTGRDVMLLQARPIVRKIGTSGTHEGPPAWALPGRPRGGWPEDVRSFFDLWDEYNPPVVQPLEYELYMRSIWQASLDMLSKGAPVPKIERAVREYDGVPVAIDPAVSLDHRPEIGPEDPIETLAVTWKARIRELRAQVGDVGRLSDDRLQDTVDEVAALYRETTRARMLSMSRWIDGERTAAEAVRSTLSAIGIEDGDQALGVLTAGVQHETARMNKALRSLAELARTGGDTPRWRMERDRFIDRFGHLGAEGGGFVYESRESLKSQIDRMKQEQESLTDTAEREALALRDAIEQKIQDVEVRRSFSDSLDALSSWIALREDSKAWQNLPRPLLHDLLQEAGRRLTRRGALARADDVELLTHTELRDAMSGSALPNEIVERRRRLTEWKRERSWLPARFLGRAIASERLVRGIAASDGIALGPARIVHGPEEFGEVRKGDVVVARATNPAWTQLFSMIAAIIVENGSRLSHAAIEARRVGIPAVVGLPGLCAAIRPGERLEVNGSAGEVIRLDAADQDQLN